MSRSSLALHSLAELLAERATLRQLHDTVETNGPPRGDAAAQAAMKRGLRFALDAIENEVARRVDEGSEPAEPGLDWARVGEWLGWHIREAEEDDGRVRELTQRVREATAALAGQEGDAFTEALRAQENAIWALIRHTADRQRGDALV
jgi:hypothetical protein